jgi:hypothetical protein
LTPDDTPSGLHSLLFLPEQVPYRDDSVKASKPRPTPGLFFLSRRFFVRVYG